MSESDGTGTRTINIQREQEEEEKDSQDVTFETYPLDEVPLVGFTSRSHRGAPYHPQCQGVVELKNQSLTAKVLALCNVPK